MPGSSRHAWKAIAILGVFAICLLLPAISAAAITVPPGSTEGDQYFEQAPNGGGSGQVNKGGGDAGASGGGQVAATHALNASGADGQAAAALANQNRPPRGGSAQGANGQSASSTEGDGGMGAWFPILLVITAVGAIAYGVRRRLNPA